MYQSHQYWPHGRKDLKAWDTHGNKVDYLTHKKVTAREE